MLYTDKEIPEQDRVAYSKVFFRNDSIVEPKHDLVVLIIDDEYTTSKYVHGKVGGNVETFSKVKLKCKKAGLSAQKYKVGRAPWALISTGLVSKVFMGNFYDPRRRKFWAEGALSTLDDPSKCIVLIDHFDDKRNENRATASINRLLSNSTLNGRQFISYSKSPVTETLDWLRVKTKVDRGERDYFLKDTLDQNPPEIASKYLSQFI